MNYFFHKSTLNQVYKKADTQGVTYPGPTLPAAEQKTSGQHQALQAKPAPLTLADMDQAQRALSDRTHCQQLPPRVHNADFHRATCMIKSSMVCP